MIHNLMKAIFKTKNHSKITNSSRLIARSSALSTLLLVLLWLALPLTAAAHPLGNFTVNRYSRLEIGVAGVKVHYVLDIAEIPTFQEKEFIDLNRDGQISETERLGYLERKTTQIQANLKLSLGGTLAPLKLDGQELSFLEGQGGLQTLRLVANFETAPLASQVNNLSYQDNNYADRLGWRELVVRNATGVALVQSNVPATDQSNELRTYPEDMLASPLALSSAQVSFRLDASVIVNSAAPSTPANIIAKAQDPFAALITVGEITLPLVLVSLLGAFVLGAFHALSPGHGKTVVAAYLVGTRGTVRHAAFLGLTVTVTHTLGVFALGLITLFASQYIVPEKLYPWLGFLSGLIVLLMGLSLFRSRLRSALPGSASSSRLDDNAHGHSHTDHSHSHNDVNNHSHSQANHEHAHEEYPAHLFEYYEDEQPAPAYAYAQTPQTSAVALSLQPSIHSSPTLTPSQPDPHAHSHAGVSHSHLPPGMDGTALTWRKLLFFGISAGLLPCPSALVVMLSAIALGRVAFGLVLIVFFSLGLAATLTGMGFLFVYARKLMSKVKFGSSSSKLKTVLRFVPIASALIVAIIGLVISYDALIQTGILSR